MSVEEEPSCYEHVFTMTDFWDGPRNGIANFRGHPHAYTSPFDDAEQDFEECYQLRPVDPDTLRLALEDWQIWQRWSDAHRAGRAALATHPALPADRARHDEIVPLLTARLAALPGPVIRARGDFRAVPEHDEVGAGSGLEVKWTVAD